jgi:hypothetical protein
VVVELFETEKSYVEAMKTLVTVSFALTLSYNPISEMTLTHSFLFEVILAA